MSERDRINYWRIKNDPEKYAAYQARKRREARAKQKQRPPGWEGRRKAAWRAANPERNALLRAAHRAVEAALRNGSLVRPECCQDCGTTGKIEAHHESYAPDQRLNVIWVCPVCHAKRDKERSEVTQRADYASEKGKFDERKSS